jgi:putative transposase
MRYRRAQIKGGTYFFTVVTFKREKILIEPANVKILREAFRYVMDRHTFTIDAFVLLPDHLHCIWTLPRNDRDFSKRWRLLKSYFTRECDQKYKQKPWASRKHKKEQAVWQRRFWEHLISDEDDMVKHVEYIHYNPVKHGMANAPKDWEYSSFHRFVREGAYHYKWGSGHEIDFKETIGRE